MVSPSDVTRDPRYLNWAVFFNSWPSVHTVLLVFVAIGLGAAFKALLNISKHFGNVDFEPIFTELAVPLLCLLLEVYAHCVSEGDVVSVEKRPGVWSLEVVLHCVYTEDEQQGREGQSLVDDNSDVEGWRHPGWTSDHA